jgi:hypothetical protein
MFLTAAAAAATTTTTTITTTTEKVDLLYIFKPLGKESKKSLQNTNLCITFRATNKSFDLLCPPTVITDKYTKSGIYKLTCNTCKRVYIE